MSNQHKRGSLVWGVVFIVAGVILLMQHLGYPISFWRTAARFWPLLLVLAGVGKIMDYYRSGHPAGLRFRDVMLVFLILIFGGFATLAARINLDRLRPFRVGHWNPPLRDIFQNSYAYEEERTHEISADVPLVVENANGTVEISPGAVEEVKVRIRKVIYGDSEPKAKAVAQKIRLIFDSDERQLKVRTNRSEWQGLVSQCDIHLFITVPKQMRCKVENRNGDTRLSGLVGDQDVYGSGGAVTINDIKGAVKVENKNKDTYISDVSGDVEALCSSSALVLSKISGNVEARNAFARTQINDVDGKVNLRDKESNVQVERVKMQTSIEAPQSAILVRGAKGEVKIEAPYNRPIHVEDVQGNVTITSSNGQDMVRNIRGALVIQSTYGDLRVADIQGPLTITAESSAVQAEGIKGVTSIQTTLKDVLVNAVESQTTIHNKYGDITLAPGATLQSNINVINENGKIDLVLPENSNFRITGVARAGSVESQFEGPKLVISRDGDESISGAFGVGGPAIKLETNHETITIRKGTEVPVRVPREAWQKQPKRGRRGSRSKNPSDIRVDDSSMKEWGRGFASAMREWLREYSGCEPLQPAHYRSWVWRKN